MAARSLPRAEVQAAEPTGAEAPRLEFHPAAPQGFGDRQNSWAWAMLWWRGRLYVGTNRCWHCAEVAGIRSVFPLFVKYPPADPEMECAPDPADLPLEAELWCWTPETDSWERLYRSPRDVPVPGRPGKHIPREVGYRYMASFSEPDGTEALYVAGVNARFAFRPVPPPRLLRSTDGRSFAPVPADPGTFLGTNDRCTFRTLIAYDQRLFAITGSIGGEGIMIESRDPARGNNSFRQVSPPGLGIFEIAIYNGFLYLGSRHPKQGYTVLKTNARGEPPYRLTTVVPEGAFAGHPSLSVISMHVFHDRLYVGTDRPAELIRINPDDSWELVVGAPRMTPDGPKQPLSGLDAGFSNWLNGHIWRVQSYAGRLYLGTWNMSTLFRNVPGADEVLSPGYGCDLYETEDGWHFTPVTLSGFDDKFNQGVRSFAVTPHGLFVGTTNDWHGLQIWRGAEPSARVACVPPERLEAEPVPGGALLSWEHPGAGARFRVLRATVRDERQTVEANPLLARLIQLVRRAVRRLMPDLYLPPLPAQLWVPGTYVEVGVTVEPYLIDRTAAPDGRYLYYVRAEGPDGALSSPSNLAGVPLLRVPATFGELRQSLDRLTRAAGAGPATALGAVYADLDRSSTQVTDGALDAAAAGLLTAARRLDGATDLLDTQARRDLGVLARKLARRCGLAAIAGIDGESLLG